MTDSDIIAFDSLACAPVSQDTLADFLASQGPEKPAELRSMLLAGTCLVSMGNGEKPPEYCDVYDFSKLDERRVRWAVEVKVAAQ